jgi:hypothetical protein
MTAYDCCLFLKHAEKLGSPSSFEKWFSEIRSNNKIFQTHGRVPEEDTDLSWRAAMDAVPHKWYGFRSARAKEEIEYTLKNLTNGAGETTVTQPFCKALFASINQAKPDLKVTVVDRHNEVSFETRKPDLVGYRHKKLQNAYYIDIIGEVKGIEGDDFSDSSRGQLVSFMSDFLRSQTHRPSIRGFLLDGVHIQMYMVFRTHATPIWEYPVMQFIDPSSGKLQEGARLLFRWLDSEAHTICLPDHIVAGAVLGHGNAATVFEAERNNKSGIMHE